jgi:hypothetical protein
MTEIKMLTSAEAKQVTCEANFNETMETINHFANKGEFELKVNEWKVAKMTQEKLREMGYGLYINDSFVTRLFYRSAVLTITWDK